MKQKGFTLIELMIVVAIIACCSAFGISGFKERAEKNAVREVETVFTTTLTNTRDECFLTGGTRRIEFDFVNREMRVFDENNNVVRRKSLPSGVTYKTTNDIDEVGVNSTGNFTSSATMFSFYVLDNKQKTPLLLVTVDRTSILLYGKLRVYKPNSKTTIDNYTNSSNWEKVREI